MSGCFDRHAPRAVDASLSLVCAVQCRTSLLALKMSKTGRPTAYKVCCHPNSCSTIPRHARPSPLPNAVLPVLESNRAFLLPALGLLSDQPLGLPDAASQIFSLALGLKPLLHSGPNLS